MVGMPRSIARWLMFGVEMSVSPIRWYRDLACPGENLWPWKVGQTAAYGADRSTGPKHDRLSKRLLKMISEWLSWKLHTQAPRRTPGSSVPAGQPGPAFWTPVSFSGSRQCEDFLQKYSHLLGGWDGIVS